MARTQRGIESLARQPAVSLVRTTAATLRAWVWVMLATLGRGAVRMNRAHHSTGCGKPPGGLRLAT
jgi:hypothetical protein